MPSFPANSSSSTEPLAAGTEVAGFRIERVLARGPRATVYEATQLSLERRVALKLFDPGTVSGDELRRLRWPEHPRIVSLYAAGTSEHGAFLAMQLVRGPARHGLRTRAQIDDVAGALDAAHRAGIAHGAVTERNVLIDADGRALLSDFGAGPRTGGAAADLAAFAELAAAVRVPARRRLAWLAVPGLLAVAALAVILTTPSPQPPAVLPGAQALGSRLAANGVASVDCTGATPSGESRPCTIVQTRLAGRSLTPARPGVIRRWAVRGARGQVALEVLRRHGRASYVVERTDYASLPDAGLHVLGANLPVRPGDRIGLEVTPGAAIGVRRGVRATTDRWFGPLALTVRPAEDGAGTGLDRELELRVEYVPGERWHPVGELTGAAAAAAPAGTRLHTEDIQFLGSGSAVLVVARIGPTIAVELVRDGHRIARLPVAGADAAGRLESVDTVDLRLGEPILRVVWDNPGGAAVTHDYVARPRRLTPLD